MNPYSTYHFRLIAPLAAAALLLALHPPAQAQQGDAISVDKSGAVTLGKGLTVSGATNVNGALNVGGRTGLGVGAGGPQAQLHVGTGSIWVNGPPEPNGLPGAGSGVRILYDTGYPEATNAGQLWAYSYSDPGGPLPLGLNAPGGNVGINTGLPQAALHVASGSLWVDNNSGSSTGKLPKAAGKGIRVLYDTGAGAGHIFTYDYNAGVVKNLLLNSNTAGGNVGIGAVLPLTKLHVQSPGDTEISIQSSDPGNRRWTLQSTGTGTLQGTFQIIDRTTPACRMLVDAQGNVGIGTTTPTKAKVQITGTQIANLGQFGWLDQDGNIGNANDDGGDPYSLYTDGRIATPQINCFSDARIKRITGLSDGARDLQTLLGLRVTNYTYSDSIARGSGPQKKLIAQQVEQVFPQAVSRITDVVPDIYQKATLKEGWVALRTGLTKGERVRLIAAGTEGIYEVLEVSADGERFRTAFLPKSEAIFVYGREVKDFRTLDYDAIAMLNVSATQQIQTEVDTLRHENEALRERLQLLEAKDKLREERLSKLEQSLPPTPAIRVHQPARQVSLNR